MEGAAHDHADPPWPSEGNNNVAMAELLAKVMADGSEENQASGGGGGGGGARSSKSLEQMMSLKPGDDERTQISKKVSWILRHGARKVGIEISEEGWVLLGDLAKCDILRGVPVQRLLDVIEESNVQKARYEFQETDHGKAIRAVAKHTLGGVAGKDRRRRDGYQGDRHEDGYGEDGGRPHPRGNRDRDRLRGDNLTYEQQLQEGYQPVYHGNKVLAMVREGETVRPGRRNDEKGEKGGKGGKGGGKGKGKGKGGFKGDEGEVVSRVWEDRRQPREGLVPWDMGKPSEDPWARPRDFKGKGKGPGPREAFRQPPLRDGHGRWPGEDEPPPAHDTRPRWRAQSGQEAIMRATKYTESEQVGTIAPGSVVVQTGEEEIMQHGIVRMPVQYYNDAADVIVRGWVTRTAEAADGPIFFRPVDGGDFQAGRGKGFFDNGKGAQGVFADRGRGGPRPFNDELQWGGSYAR